MVEKGFIMSDFIKKFIYWLSKKQVKTLKRTQSAGRYVNSTSKTVYTGAGSLQLTSKTEQNKEKLKLEVENILKKYKNNPEKLIDFVENHGTKVYKIPYANKILKVIGYDEGFVGKTSGIKARYLNLVTSLLSKEKLNISNMTKDMFILEKNTPLNVYYVIQYFYKWSAMKLNLPGFDSISQQNFQKLYSSKNENADIKSLSVDEILGLKEAIARDVEAINFVIEMAKSTAGAKQAMEKLRAGSATV